VFEAEPRAEMRPPPPVQSRDALMAESDDIFEIRPAGTGPERAEAGSAAGSPPGPDSVQKAFHPRM